MQSYFRRKSNIIFPAEQIAEHMQIETLEGTMMGNPGDWLVTGVRGEQWFVKDEIFKETYEPIVPDPWIA